MSNLKWAKISQQSAQQRRHPDCKQAHVTREMQMRMRYHCTPTRMNKVPTYECCQTPNAIKDEEQWEFSVTVGENAMWQSHCKSQFDSASQN